MDESIGQSGTMDISIHRDSSTPLYRQVEAQIRALILDGRLPRGSRLPAERTLARHLGVNRTTVVNAYRELSADGLVEGQVGRGTVVLGDDLEPQVPCAWRQGEPSTCEEKPSV